MKNIKELAHNSESVITIVPTCKESTLVCCGEDGLFSNLKKGSLVIDSSTIDPESAKKLNTIGK